MWEGLSFVYQPKTVYSIDPSQMLSARQHGLPGVPEIIVNSSKYKYLLIHGVPTTPHGIR